MFKKITLKNLLKRLIGAIEDKMIYALKLLKQSRDSNYRTVIVYCRKLNKNS